MSYRVSCFSFFIFFLSFFYTSEVAAKGIYIFTPEKSLDTSYIRSYHKLLGIKTFLFQSPNQLLIKQEGRRYLNYKTNGNLNLGVGLDFRGLGLSTSVAFDFLNNDQDKYGKTREANFKYYIYKCRFIHELNMQYFKGFYVSNPQLLPQPEKESELGFPKRNDINTLTLGISSFYIFNYDKYSVQATFSNITQQLQSAGSWLAGGFYYHNVLSSDSSLSNDITPQKVLQDVQLIRIQSNSYGVGGGYAYTYVLKRKLFIAGTAIGGFSLDQHRGLTFGSSSVKWKYGLGLKLQSRLSLGYNSRSLYSRLEYLLDYNISNNPLRSQIIWGNSITRLIMGIRFDVMQWFSKR